MPVEKIFASLIALNILSAVGCARVETIPGDMPHMDRVSVMMDAVSPDDSSVSQSSAASMLVLTVTQDVHNSLTSGKRIQPQMTMGVTINTDATPAGYENFLDELSDRYGLSRVADWPLVSINARCLVMQSSGLIPRTELVASLTEDPRIEEAQPLNLFSTLADSAPDSDSSTTYNDPYLDLQHGFRTMQVKTSHQWATGNNITVAVVDTGVDVNHPDLSERVTLARNFVDRDSTAFHSDVHGTAVSAVIAATAGNETGIVGVAPNARLLALKGCWQSSTENGITEPAAICSSFTLAKSIDFAVLQNIDVLNLSLTGPPDPLLEALVENAIAKGVSVVGALDASNPDSFPGYVEGVLTVGDSHAAEHGKLADVNAPGKKVFSAKPKSDYDFFSGSSISAAQISGLIALIRERRPHIAPGELLSLLQSASAKTRGAVDKRSVNACRALAAAVKADAQKCR